MPTAPTCSPTPSKPHGGIVMWRAFVYDASVDPDRIKRAYKEFVPLDGTFRDNVFVQTKNGPLDFMPREPYHPVFGAMPKTPNIVELQITQEYLGHSTHLVYLAPMWKEFFDSDTFAEGRRDRPSRRLPTARCRATRRTAIAGVANTGSDRNWTGHHFAAANWYAFGRLAWDSSLTSEAIADEWIRQTWSRTPDDREGDRDADARLARGVRELHDAARPPSPDWRRSLRGDARERRQAPARLVGDSTTTAPTRRASASTARGTAAAPSTSTPGRTPTGGTIRRPRRRTCCSGSTTCRGTTG